MINNLMDEASPSLRKKRTVITGEDDELEEAANLAALDDKTIVSSSTTPLI